MDLARWWAALVDWSTTERWGLLVALAVAIGGFIKNRRDARSAKDAADEARKNATEAQDTADRAATAAEGSRAAQDRMADAFAGLLERMDRRDADEARRRRYVDRLTTASGHTAAPAPSPSPTPPGSVPPAGPPPSGLDVRWTIRKVSKGNFELVNIGDAIAHDVQISSSTALRLNVKADMPIDELAPGQDVGFMALGSWQTETPRVEVEWSDPHSEERRTWSRIVP